MFCRSNKKRVFVGMSGGVDSSVSAALLKRAGFDVAGVFIKVWQPDWVECTWKEERREAMRAAAHIGIPFFTIDLEKEYKKDVIDYMIEEYRAGRTPNPDVMCNRYVKFGAFWEWAKSRGADYLATGHYATVKKTKDGIYHLLKGTDPDKDQSYFLWTLRQNDLEHALFPVGDMIKPEVRRLARKFGLPNADKKDSQGLCFIGKVDVKDFLGHYIDTTEGVVLDEQGREIGRHPGSTLFTIGERHGFTITTDRSPNDRPFFIVGKDIKTNTITVSNKDDRGFLDKSLDVVDISNVSWVIGKSPVLNSNIEVRCRYRQPLEKAKLIESNGNRAVVRFENAQCSITPGQSMVIYGGDECLGGGIIC